MKLRNMSRDTELTVEGKAIRVSNLSKVLYPDTGFTKGDVINYYIRAAPVLLPHLRNRPLTLKRYPDGVNGLFFYEKQCPSHRPPWIKTTRVSRNGDRGHIDYCVINNLPALVWAINLADLELHTFLHRARTSRPTSVVFDLDPGPPAGIALCCRVALWLREILTACGLQCFAKTSGSKGMQLYLPLNTAATYENTKLFAHTMAEHLEQERPDTVVSRMRKADRPGKVFVDWSQNDDHKTTVCVYSLRAKERPTVSTPLTWDEVEAGTAGDARLTFDSTDALRRIEDYGDLFSPVLNLEQKLPSLQAAGLSAKVSE